VIGRTEGVSGTTTGHSNVGRIYDNKVGRRDAGEFLAILKKDADKIAFQFAS
jgi:hypothetical protein